MATGKAGVCSIGTVHTANKKRETAQARTLGAGWEECEGKLRSTGFALKTCVTFDDVSFCGERCTHELSTLRALREDIKSPGAGVTSGHEPPNKGSRIKLESAAGSSKHS